MSQAALAEPRPAAPPAKAAGTGSRGSEFAPLLRTVKGQGLLEKRTGRYALGIAVNALALAAIITAMVLIGSSWWALLLAVPLGVFSARTAFIGHDACHSQISGSRRVNRVIGVVHANLLLGMSAAWWTDKHNRHHANPNHLEKDPDVAPDVLVFADEHAVGRTGFKAWLTRHQAWLFFPLCLLEGLNLKVNGFKDLRRQAPRERAVEGITLLLHLAAYVTLLLTTLTVGQALLFALIHQGLFGLHLGLAFAPNHKGMEMPDSHDTGSERWGHLRRQVLTSRNIRGSALTDWFLGGLNYQIEHHLFPSMPRPHLRLAQPLVRAHCRELGISYAETGVVDSYRQALRHLREVGEPLRVEFD
ncbi:acyl-CoA desaturase [Streptomyces sp. NBC_01304]|uniref:acyl-CoA desaturase n=1 Tax=Streptomyces sp. NBC_01304 TaxID=2903818 RepID=UPI002E12B105|nr:acyl-CoA desaturase [Streptomyces sp. NBC_01304]